MYNRSLTADANTETELVEQDDNLELPAPSHGLAVITETSLESEVIRDDVRLFNQNLKELRAAWKQAKTIDQVCKLSLIQTKVIESRRKALNMQWGKEGSDSNKSKWFGPYNGNN